MCRFDCALPCLYFLGLSYHCGQVSIGIEAYIEHTVRPVIINGINIYISSDCAVISIPALEYFAFHLHFILRRRYCFLSFFYPLRVLRHFLFINIKETNQISICRNGLIHRSDFRRCYDRIINLRTGPPSGKLVSVCGVVIYVQYGQFQIFPVHYLISLISCIVKTVNQSYFMDFLQGIVLFYANVIITFRIDIRHAARQCDKVKCHRGRPLLLRIAVCAVRVLIHQGKSIRLNNPYTVRYRHRCEPFRIPERTGTDGPNRIGQYHYVQVFALCKT